MSSIATHHGTVVDVCNGIVKVEMHVVSACSSCKAHEKCAFVDKDDKIVDVETDQWQQFAKGDNVIVSVNESLGLLAVLLAYILPAIVIIASIALLQLLNTSEAITALATLAVTVLYFLLLYLFHNKLQRHFSFGIEPVLNE
ncbi:MAG: SoxR reducing system RseC family protein [Bacteroidales bacterium]|nr:SoxR reducing system RseC family protein [Bacteroidales bacterium]